MCGYIVHLSVSWWRAGSDQSALQFYINVPTVAVIGLQQTVQKQTLNISGRRTSFWLPGPDRLPRPLRPSGAVRPLDICTARSPLPGPAVAAGRQLAAVCHRSAADAVGRVRTCGDAPPCSRRWVEWGYGAAGPPVLMESNRPHRLINTAPPWGHVKITWPEVISWPWSY